MPQAKTCAAGNATPAMQRIEVNIPRKILMVCCGSGEETACCSSGNTHIVYNVTSESLVNATDTIARTVATRFTYFFTIYEELTPINNLRYLNITHTPLLNPLEGWGKKVP